MNFRKVPEPLYTNGWALGFSTQWDDVPGPGSYHIPRKICELPLYEQQKVVNHSEFKFI